MFLFNYRSIGKLSLVKKNNSNVEYHLEMNSSMSCKTAYNQLKKNQQTSF